jgi:hypothetical protein
LLGAPFNKSLDGMATPRTYKQLWAQLKRPQMVPLWAFANFLVLATLTLAATVTFHLERTIMPFVALALVGAAPVVSAALALAQWKLLGEARKVGALALLLGSAWVCFTVVRIGISIWGKGHAV